MGTCGVVVLIILISHLSPNVYVFGHARLLGMMPICFATFSTWSFRFCAFCVFPAVGDFVSVFAMPCSPLLHESWFHVIFHNFSFAENDALLTLLLDIPWRPSTPFLLLPTISLSKWGIPLQL